MVKGYLNDANSSSLKRLHFKFAQPGAEYRSLPFWAWNDALQAEELKRQVQEMKAQGMGGFFMHSREGLETEYLGKDWMHCINETVREAERLGMHAWLYDEDRWPSGFAGGLVQAKSGDEARAKGLTLELIEPGQPLPADIASQALALFKAEINDHDLLKCQRLHRAQDVEAQEVLLVFRVEIAKRVDGFNNEAPPDNLNPASVRTFIDITYEAYKKEVGDYFGGTVRGIFTDEPSIHDRRCRFTEGRGWIPWTWALPAFFQRQRGYDLLDFLPFIYFNGEHSTAIRHDYWRTIAEMFSESYTKQLFDWCEQHGLAFTGHFLSEGNLGTGTRTCGAIMPNYRYQHVPGIDMLTERTTEVLTVKQCSSVANQYGRRFVLTETYGCTGWQFTFEGQKWIGDFQYVLGVNLRSQHLGLYSIKGCRKRDYPPVFNYNTSWWKYNHVVEDYFARLSAVLTEGRPLRDVLVLHPASTAWTMLGTNPYGFSARSADRDLPVVNQYGNQFKALLRELLGAHYDFDLGDETIMAEAGAVRGDRIMVNLADYRTVVIPAIQSMLRSTFELLLEFVAAGGSIVAVGPMPTMLEGRVTDELTKLYDHPNVTIVEDGAEMVQAFERVLPRKVSICNELSQEAAEFLYMFRALEDGYVLFVVNNDRDGAHRVTIKVGGIGSNVSMEQWCALTGQKQRVAVENGDGDVVFSAHFGPADSKLYVIRNEELVPNCEESDKAVKPAIMSGGADAQGEVVAELSQPSRVTRTMPNVLVLDTCSYRFGNEERWSVETDVWKAQRAIREALGMRAIYANGGEQRYRWIAEPHPNDKTPVQLKFQFYVSEVPKGDLALVLEGAEHYAIQLNSCKLSNRADGWFLDKTFDRVPLTGLKQGWNELIIGCHYKNEMELEDCYLIGDFAVDIHRSITAEPQSLELGDWCRQGYYHYCGSLVYTFDFNIENPSNDVAVSGGIESIAESGDTFVLELGAYSAVTVEVRVNGQSAGHIPWRAANSLDLTRLLRGGNNQIEIEVMGSPRNMLGPFHQAAGETPVTSWASFRKEGDDYTPEYNVHPYGLLSPVTIIKYPQRK